VKPGSWVGRIGSQTPPRYNLRGHGVAFMLRAMGNHTRRYFFLVLSLAALAASSAPTVASAEPAGALEFERIFAEPPLEGRAPVALLLSPSGTFASWLAPNEVDSEVLDLWGMQLPDGKPQRLVATADLLAGGVQKLTEAEKMALERKRISKRGITGYSWCGEAGDTLLFPFSGDLYVARLAAKTNAPTVTRLTRDEDVPELNPKCSPDGSRVAFVKGHNVTVMTIATASAQVVTNGGTESHYFGLAEFVAEEEMGRHEAIWWSADGKRLLVFEVDESPVSEKKRAQIHAAHTDIVTQRYPAAGEANAKVSAWIMDVASDKAAKPVRLQTPMDDGYLARGGFFADGTAWVQWQSRDQRQVRVLEAVGTTGTMREVLRETDAAWVELHDDLRSLGDGQSFIWSSERSGRRQLGKVDRATGTWTPITQEPEAVESLLAVDKASGKVLYAAYRDRGRQLQVFATGLNGGPATQLTSQAGWHSATFDSAGKYFLDRYSDLLVPTQTTIRDSAGKIVHTVDANPAKELAAFAKPHAIWMDVKTSDGTILNGLLLAPVRSDEVAARGKRRYPVIAYIYGGPGAQTVRRAWQRTWLPLVAWTHRGYGVFLLDNRGMAGRDRDFTRGHLGRFGDIEIEDQHAGLAALKEVPWVDPARIGIFGWSYGGFLAARAVLEADAPYAAAASVAPVTDWTLYDTHYTERYIGVPGPSDARNKTYTSSDLTTRVASLERPLLLVHGTADDNVLFENTLRLTEALQNAGKAFEMMIYPGKAHGISGRASQLHVWKTLTAFFDRHLTP